MTKSRMFNHDDDFDAVQSEKQKESQPQEMKCPLEDAALRQMRLMERNNDLVSAFRELKPGIFQCHNMLEVLCKSTGAIAGTMLKLQDLLKSSFPIRFSQEEKTKIQQELDAIVASLTEAIRRESVQAIDRIHKREKQVCLSPACFWIMVVSIIILSLFFILVTYANIEILHNHILTKLITIFVTFICATLIITVYISHRYR